MDYIRVTAENIKTEHICCAISKDDDEQVSSKKAWLSDRFAEGLVFLKSVERGKCFIEYIPAEAAWIPIEADGYTYIECMWVAGSLKGHGYSNDLLSECIRDSKEKGKIGLCILSSAKKRAFMSDPKYLAHKGFTVCDESSNGTQLWYLPFEDDAPRPQFKPCARHPHVDKQGYVLYYTSQCPFNAKYVPRISKAAKEHGIPFRAIRLDTREKAQNAPTPNTTYTLFYNGEFLTSVMMNEAKFEDMIMGK